MRQTRRYGLAAWLRVSRSGPEVGDPVPVVPDVEHPGPPAQGIAVVHRHGRVVHLSPAPADIDRRAPPASLAHHAGDHSLAALPEPTATGPHRDRPSSEGRASHSQMPLALTVDQLGPAVDRGVDHNTVFGRPQNRAMCPLGGTRRALDAASGFTHVPRRSPSAVPAVVEPDGAASPTAWARGRQVQTVVDPAYRCRGRGPRGSTPASPYRGVGKAPASAATIRWSRPT